MPMGFERTVIIQRTLNLDLNITGPTPLDLDQNFDALPDRLSPKWFMKKRDHFVKKYITKFIAKIKEERDFFLFLYGDPRGIYFLS